MIPLPQFHFLTHQHRYQDITSSPLFQRTSHSVFYFTYLSKPKFWSNHMSTLSYTWTAKNQPPSRSVPLPEYSVLLGIPFHILYDIYLEHFYVQASHCLCNLDILQLMSGSVCPCRCFCCTLSSRLVQHSSRYCTHWITGVLRSTICCFRIRTIFVIHLLFIPSTTYVTF